MNRVTRCMLILAATVVCGCARAPVLEKPVQVPGVKRDLAGANDPSLRALVKFYARQGKIFLYASSYTDSPIVAKADVPFASQFRIATLRGGFREAAAFNGYMLEYIRERLRQGVCPEHPEIALARAGKAFVCPVDNRTFIPCDLNAKPASEPK
jgi:hypothetical protein